MSNSANWQTANSQSPCPICGAKKWCSTDSNGSFTNCRFKNDGCIREKIDSNGDPYFVHKGPNYVEGKTFSARSYVPRRPLGEDEAVEHRDKIYRRFMDLCLLHDDHMEHLHLQRGFFKETIQKSKYSSARNLDLTVQRLYSEFGDGLFDVPGFTKKQVDGITKVQTLKRSGIFIPSMNLKGQISSLRLRVDEVDDSGSRYYWFSLRNGVKLDPNIHVAYGSLHDNKTLIVTEGEFKATRFTQQFPTHTALGLPGISSCRRSLQLISELKPERIVLAPDRDIEKNHGVFRPVARLFGELKNLGYNVQFLYWSDHDYKGVDDALQGKCELEYLSTPEAEEYLRFIGKNLNFPDDLINKGFSGCDQIEKFDDEWDREPEEIEFGSKPLPQIDDSDLPAIFRNYIKDCAERISVSIEYISLSVFAVAASLIGRKLAIRPKLKDTWTIVPVLWPMLIGRPSKKKSPALGCGIAFLENLSAEIHDQNEKNHADWLAESKILSQERDNLLKSLNSRGRRTEEHEDSDNSNNSRDEIKEQIARIEYQLRNGRPAEVVYFVSDTTKEALVDVLKDNPNGLLIVRDELSAWLKGLNIKGREQDRGLYLELYNGKVPYVERRRSREAVSLKATVASIVGGIQPGPLAEYISAANNGGSGADGLMARFVLIWPDDVPYRYVDREPNIDAFNDLQTVMKNLSTFSAKNKGIEAMDKSGLPYIGFSQHAQSLFVTWLISNIEKEARESKSEALEAFLGKHPNTVCTLALIFHLCEQLSTNCEKLEPISYNSLVLAIRWGEIIEAHARKTYLGCSSPEVAKSLILLEKIESGSLTNGLTVREIYRKNWPQLKKRCDVISGMALLEKAGCAKVVSLKSNTNGTVSEVVLIHPSLRRNIVSETNI
ncbi:DUF3987 domain-containing protein [Bdellovibrio sp. NC01]|uniref:DUF3987 domain-containing protein n=1 Tax=Bdellovibrio sp. NC01 TaxID=2220073 RepID=UPI00115871CB|nr:DUF3987 domain-containing protein [Bdellovibrio sp. NC01]QDK37191.1 hypothetical protein DOE51_06110 [Bdellovibrio sp. NC01]